MPHILYKLQITKKDCRTIVLRIPISLARKPRITLILKNLRPCNPVHCRTHQTSYLLPSAVLGASVLPLSFRGVRGGVALLTAASCRVASNLWARVVSEDSAISIKTRSRRWIRVRFEGMMCAGGVRSIAERGPVRYAGGCAARFPRPSTMLRCTA